MLELFFLRLEVFLSTTTTFVFSVSEKRFNVSKEIPEVDAIFGSEDHANVLTYLTGKEFQKNDPDFFSPNLDYNIHLMKSSVLQPTINELKSR